jgi:hypothetical protein
MSDMTFIPRGVVAAPGSAEFVKLSADAVACLVEQMQMARWTLQRVSGELEGGIEPAMVQRRIDALALLVQQLADGAASSGVVLELSAEAAAMAEVLAAGRAGPAH